MSSEEEKVMEEWSHPGGKLLCLGPEACTNTELLAILIGTGYKGKSALDIAKELLYKYYSINGLMGQRLSEMAQIKGLKDVKLTRIAAAFELARRIIKEFEKGNIRI